MPLAAVALLRHPAIVRTVCAALPAADASTIYDPGQLLDGARFIRSNIDEGKASRLVGVRIGHDPHARETNVERTERLLDVYDLRFVIEITKEDSPAFL